MPKKLSERLIKWIKAQKCTGADRGWRYLMVELAQCVEALVEAVEPEDTCAECEFYISFCCGNAPGYFGGWKFTKPNTTACKRFVASSSESEDTELAEAQERLEVRRSMCESWEGRCLKAERELIEAKADLANWRESCLWWKQRCDNANHDVTRLQGITSAQAPRIEELETEIKLQRRRAEVAESRLAEAKEKWGRGVKEYNELRTEIATLQEQLELQWAATMMGKPLGPELEAQWEVVKANAKIGELVRKMPDGTGLQHTGCHYYAMKCFPGLGWRATVGSCTTDPAEALRSIQQKVGDAKS